MNIITNGFFAKNNMYIYSYSLYIYIELSIYRSLGPLKRILYKKCLS